MRVTLITPTPPDICAFGVRSLSAFMKSKGHSVRSIFLPTSYERWEVRKGLVYTYQSPVLEAVVDLAKESDLVGISFMTNYFDAAVQVTRKIQEDLDVPIIWGGVHPTVMPEECLDYVDMVCLGEGEEALCELLERMAQGRAYDDVRNLWVRKDRAIKRNHVRPLIQDLDSLPFYDFELRDQYVIDMRKNQVVPLDQTLYRLILPREPFFNDSLQIAFRTYTSRGCPHHCSYCINPFLKRMYPGQRYLRMISVDKVMRETERLLDRFPFIETLVFFDDTFLARGMEEIAAFSESYRKRIGLPFRIQASPATVSRKKMAYLAEAGLVFVEMGIQTGSNWTKRLYGRKTSNEKVMAAADIIHDFQHRMLPPRYHVILDNPWETPQDVAETLRMLARFPKPFSLARSSLVLYPGTTLYEKAGEERALGDRWEEIYRKNFCAPKPSYLNLLIHLAGLNYLPRPVLESLSAKGPVTLLDRGAFRWAFEMLEALLRIVEVAMKGLGAFIRGDFKRIYRYVEMRRHSVK